MEHPWHGQVYDSSGIPLLVPTPNIASLLAASMRPPNEKEDVGWVLYDPFELCCERNLSIYKSYDKLMPQLTALPYDWKENPRCVRLCPDLKKLMTYKPPVLRHPQAANPDTEYAFTLTMPPDYTPVKPVEEVARLILEKGITNKPYEKASEWAFVLEHTEKGTPHIHGVYKTPSGRRLASKYFNRYWPLWDEKTKLGAGHKGGYHAPARHSESYHAYLLKEGVVVKNISDQSINALSPSPPTSSPPPPDA